MPWQQHAHTHGACAHAHAHAYAHAYRHTYTHMHMHARVAQTACDGLCRFSASLATLPHDLLAHWKTTEGECYLWCQDTISDTYSVFDRQPDISSPHLHSRLKWTRHGLGWSRSSPRTTRSWADSEYWPSHPWGCAGCGQGTRSCRAQLSKRVYSSKVAGLSHSQTQISTSAT